MREERISRKVRKSDSRFRKGKKRKGGRERESVREAKRETGQDQGAGQDGDGDVDVDGCARTVQVSREGATRAVG